ncbi:MAG: cytidylate kinase-like family protein, partial [Clostridium sp.]|nr:cytidylate kinase-like family protein [Clostridium sp.]
YEFDTKFGPRYANLTNRVIYNQFEVIQKFAEKSSCVIIGRCSDYILKDRKDCLNIFIYAPEKVRIQSIMEKNNVSEKEAEEMMKYNDEIRK